jgi:hypothetical protein
MATGARGRDAGPPGRGAWQGGLAGEGHEPGRGRGGGGARQGGTRDEDMGGDGVKKKGEGTGKRERGRERGGELTSGIQTPAITVSKP